MEGCGPETSPICRTNPNPTKMTCPVAVQTSPRAVQESRTYPGRRELPAKYIFSCVQKMLVNFPFRYMLFLFGFRKQLLHLLRFQKDDYTCFVSRQYFVVFQNYVSFLFLPSLRALKPFGLNLCIPPLCWSILAAGRITDGRMLFRD